MESSHVVPVRGTQSFVHTLSACWKRPSLTALEVLWRWAFGAPAAGLIWYEALRVWRETPVDVDALKRMSILDPMSAAATLSQTADLLMPGVLRVAEWLAPLLLVVWVVASSLGRVAVLRRVDTRLRARPGTVMVLQALRVTALAGSFVAWFACLQAAAGYAVNGPIAAGQEPNLVLYCALAIVTTLGMFVLWAVVSWALSVAPLLAMLRNLGAGASLKAAFRLGPVRGKLVEINLVMGIVKIALVVLAMAFSACPLPFASVATPDFMLRWYGVVTVLYLVASDFFHVVRLVAYLELWKAYDGGGAGGGP
ncbi:MAG: hypothetical protein ABSG84_16330 [Acidobacteriaceae bacterium]|jgi:hypothetical protein